MHYRRRLLNFYLKHPSNKYLQIFYVHTHRFSLYNKSLKVAFYHCIPLGVFSLLSILYDPILVHTCSFEFTSR